MPVVFNDALRNEYQQLFNTCIISPTKAASVEACVNNIVSNKDRYAAVAAQTGVPWYFIGIIHNMECSGNFGQHLHNGDPLTARTTHVPAGRPKDGNPPFEWEDSAVDSLRLEGLDKWTDWSVPGTLFKMEGYNGFGYRVRGVNTPYLWSFSNQYTKGKFTGDGVFDPNAVSKQIGAAVLLRRLSEKGLAVAGEVDAITLIKKVGAEVQFNPDVFDKGAETLQVLLNSVGQHLKVDGKAGQNTSDAYQRISGVLLQGDPRLAQASVPA